MNSTILHDLATAHISDLHRQAGTDALSLAARRARQAPATKSTPFMPAHTTASSSAACSPCSVPAGPRKRPDRGASTSPRPYPDRSASARRGRLGKQPRVVFDPQAHRGRPSRRRASSAARTWSGRQRPAPHSSIAAVSSASSSSWEEAARSRARRRRKSATGTTTAAWSPRWITSYGARCPGRARLARRSSVAFLVLVGVVTHPGKGGREEPHGVVAAADDRASWKATIRTTSAGSS